ncbi:Gfo/Idh/MocA family protein [Euzebya sp.]|uniref:Gfo/Idh/MocA family protein n=1 Tax=Euzebya sp. TaxID=1971409 RepID=UPI003513ABCC
MRYGVIGTGHWATTVHAAGIARSTSDELVGVWGRTPAKREALAESFGVEAFASAEAMFAEVEAVAFAVPPDVQAPLAVAAAEAGCHLLLEKPIALDTGAASAIVDAVERAGVRSVVFLTLRFEPATAAWLADVRERDDWEGLDAAWLGDLYAEDSPYRESAWRQRHGSLWDLGPHVLSLAIPIMGPVVDVVARRGRGDLVRLVLTHQSGGTSGVTLSHTSSPAASRRGLDLHGPAGGSSMPEGEGADDAFPAALAALAESVRSGRPHECDAAFGLEHVRLLEAAQAVLDEVAGSA